MNWDALFLVINIGACWICQQAYMKRRKVIAVFFCGYAACSTVHELMILMGMK